MRELLNDIPRVPDEDLCVMEEQERCRVQKCPKRKRVCVCVCVCVCVWRGIGGHALECYVLRVLSLERDVLIQSWNVTF